MATRQFALVCFRLRAPEEVGGPKLGGQRGGSSIEEVNATGSGPYMSSANVGGGAPSGACDTSVRRERLCRIVLLPSSVKW